MMTNCRGKWLAVALAASENGEEINTGEPRERVLLLPVSGSALHYF
jgi:hypothetical protein